MADEHEDAAPVPHGERAELQHTARRTGERMGRQEAQLEQHARHFADINGHIARLADKTETIATAVSVQAVTLAGISETVDRVGRSHEGRLAEVEDFTSELRGGRHATQRAVAATSTWVLWAIGLAFTAFIAGVGLLVTIVLAIVTLYANGKL